MWVSPAANLSSHAITSPRSLRDQLIGDRLGHLARQIFGVVIAGVLGSQRLGVSDYGRRGGLGQEHQQRPAGGLGGLHLSLHRIGDAVAQKKQKDIAAAHLAQIGLGEGQGGCRTELEQPGPGEGDGLNRGAHGLALGLHAGDDRADEDSERFLHGDSPLRQHLV